MSGPSVEVAPTREALAERAAERLRATLAARTGRVTLALSGGSTPKALYRRLAALGRGALPWERTTILFSDERALPPDHPDSNVKMAKATLLEPLGLEALLPDAARRELDAAARDYERALLGAAGDPPAVDVVLLGLGDDGHTASLFPGEAEPAGWVAATFAPPDTPAPRRLSFTFRTLLAARSVLMLVSGASKAARLREVLAAPGPLPAQRVLHGRAGETVVLADAEAYPFEPQETR